MNIGLIIPLFYVDLNTSLFGQVYMVDLDCLIEHIAKSTPHVALIWTV